MLKKFFAVSIIMLLSATGGSAQSAAVKACAGEFKLLCAGIQPGEGRVKACIKSHFSDVSAPWGGGRIEGCCMKSHLSEVSDPCKDAVTQGCSRQRLTSVIGS
jgi:hypothetical protein